MDEAKGEGMNRTYKRWAAATTLAEGRHAGLEGVRALLAPTRTAVEKHLIPMYRRFDKTKCKMRPARVTVHVEGPNQPTNDEMFEVLSASHVIECWGIEVHFPDGTLDLDPMMYTSRSVARRMARNIRARGPGHNAHPRRVYVEFA